MMPMKGKRAVVPTAKVNAKTILNTSDDNDKKVLSKKPPSPLQRLFSKQQAKLRTTTRTSKLLKLYADDSYVNIAKLIQKWLSEKN
jgi:hypothetical protein